MGRLIRYAKVAALLSAAWTIVCALLVLGLQAKVWVADEIWPVFTLSTVIGPDVYDTASISETKFDLLNAIYELPIMAVLAVGLAFIIAFYLWLGRLERANATGLKQ